MSLVARIEEWRRQLERPGVRSSIQNTGWLAGEKVLQLGVGFFLGVWAARALGPEQFGLYNYALAFATLFGAGANLGTEGVVVRDLVRHPERAAPILGTVARLRLAGALGLTGAMALAAAIAHRGEPPTLTLVLVFGAATLFKPFDVVDLWFQARMQVVPAIRARVTAFLIGSAVRAGVLVSGASVLALAVVEPLTAALAAMFLVAVFRRFGPGSALARQWDRAQARELLRESWPMLLSSVAVVVYMRIDQVMIEGLGGANATHAVGIYSAALRLSEAWYFIPIAIVTSVFPHIVQSRTQGSAIYASRLARLYATLTAIALAVALPMTFLAGPLITFVFGPSYADASPVLAVHIWSTVFVFWGVLGSAWFVNEGLTRLSLLRTLQGAAVNVALNLVLIPRHGAVGAAVATLVSQACVASLLNAMDARTRPLFLVQVRSLLLRGLFA